MLDELIKSNLNLYAVLKNLEDLVAYDKETAELAKNWNISIQFSVKNGPKAYVAFKNGICTVDRGKIQSPSVILYFTSPAHLNKMFDNKANPIPLKGFTKLGFLQKEFPKATDKLTYYLKPTDELLKDEEYLKLNTRFTLTTAAFATRELAEFDPLSMISASHMGEGTVMMRVLPDGPAVNITAKNKQLYAAKGMVDNPMAFITMKDYKVANDFLNGKIDAYTAITAGDIVMYGQIPLVDNLSLILDRISHYIS